MSVKRKVTVPVGRSRIRAPDLVATRPARPAAMVPRLRRLAERDHGDEHEAGDQHPQDDLLAFGRGVFREPESEREHDTTLPCDPGAVRGERALGGRIVWR